MRKAPRGQRCAALSQGESVVEAVFMGMDRDGSGTVDQAELHAAFKHADASNDGQLSKEEFLQAIRQLPSGALLQEETEEKMEAEQVWPSFSFGSPKESSPRFNLFC